MKYKMIVTDLDDTLLNSEKKISPIDLQAIMKVQEAGVKFILCSGRPTFAMRDLAKEIEAEKFNEYILSFNGSIITNCIADAGSGISSKALYPLDSSVEYIDVEVNLTKMNHRLVKSFKEYVDRGAVKCMLLAEPSYLKKVEVELKKEYGDKYSIAISKPFFLEVTKLGIDKGVAVKKLAEKLNIPIEEVIAVGDSFNDLPMLKAAGTSVAVENAQPEIKEQVDFIVKSNNDGGIADLIEKFVFYHSNN